MRTTTLTTRFSSTLGISIMALGKPDLETGALDHLAILIIVCIILRIHTIRKLDTYIDTKFQTSR